MEAKVIIGVVGGRGSVVVDDVFFIIVVVDRYLGTLPVVCTLLGDNHQPRGNNIDVNRSKTMS